MPIPTMSCGRRILGANHGAHANNGFFTMLSLAMAFAAMLPTTSGYIHHTIRTNPQNTLHPRNRIRFLQPLFATEPGPPQETKPDYANIHGPMGKEIDDIFLSMFRTKLSEQVGIDSDKPKVRSDKLQCAKQGVDTKQKKYPTMY